MVTHVVCNLATIRGFSIILKYVKNVNPIRIVLDSHLKATTPVQRNIFVSFQHSTTSHICILAVC